MGYYGLARGPVRSAPAELVAQQDLTLARQGYREIVITGIEIASWGVDLPGKPPVTTGVISCTPLS